MDPKFEWMPPFQLRTAPTLVIERPGQLEQELEASAESGPPPPSPTPTLKIRRGPAGRPPKLRQCPCFQCVLVAGTTCEQRLKMALGTQASMNLDVMDQAWSRSALYFAGCELCFVSVQPVSSFPDSRTQYISARLSIRAPDLESFPTKVL